MRGHAVVELAVALPLLAACLGAAVAVAKRVHAKLKAQEAGRFAAWEMTAWPLGDYASGAHEDAFGRAAKGVADEVARRYGARAVFHSSEALEGDLPLALGGPGENGPEIEQALSAGRKGLRAALLDWRMNVRGQVQADVSAVGGFSHRYALIADGWALPDGRDAVVRSGRAGNTVDGAEPHLMYPAVKRMTFWGVSGLDASILGLSGLLRDAGLAPPALAGTFVVSHNYRRPRQEADACEGIPGYPQEARGGLSRFGSEAIDFERPQCFDTAPFRDTHAYAQSLYLRMFGARGRYAMGCKWPQADDDCGGAP